MIGEFTVLVGPSGGRKSTTLRILAGLETLSRGETYFDDKLISALDPKERDIAMVFQDYALHPHKNIARNMSFALDLAKVPKPEIASKVQRLSKLLNTNHLLDRAPAELSGGKRQRVAMGRAMVRDVVALSSRVKRMMPLAVLLVPVFGIWTFQFQIDGTRAGIILVYVAMNALRDPDIAKLHRAGIHPARGSRAHGRGRAVPDLFPCGAASIRAPMVARLQGGAHL